MPPRRSGARRAWVRYASEDLLDLRIRDLGLRIERTALAARIRRLYDELDAAGLRFKPYVWLSSDWFTPDGLTGFAVPFYLAHPRLLRLEREQMLEVEGGTHDACMRLLRHETAHAIDNAYRLHRRKRWREVFGPFSTPYRESYVPRPTSRKYAHNLDYFYAQSHPCEDFAETFAVWLRPRSAWRQHYAGWPALKKLEYVDGLMAEIADRAPTVRTRRRPESAATLSVTLRDYYRLKQARYHEDGYEDYDSFLGRLFSADAFYRRRPAASQFLRKHRAELRRRVAAVTGQHQYLIDQVLKDLIPRARALRLRLTRSERDTRLDAAVMLATLTMSFVHGGHPRYMR